MKGLNKVLLIALASLTLCISSCKKAAKEVAEDVSGRMTARQVAKEASEEALEKIGKKELKVIKWADLVDAISKKKAYAR